MTIVHEKIHIKTEKDGLSSRKTLLVYVVSSYSMSNGRSGYGHCTSPTSVVGEFPTHDK